MYALCIAFFCDTQKPPTWLSFCPAHSCYGEKLLRRNRIFWSSLAVAVVYFSPSVMPFITSLSERSRLRVQQLIEMTFENTHAHCPRCWELQAVLHTHAHTPTRTRSRIL